jgi:hypothetical protein
MVSPGAAILLQRDVLIAEFVPTSEKRFTVSGGDLRQPGNVQVHTTRIQLLQFIHEENIFLGFVVRP